MDDTIGRKKYWCYFSNNFWLGTTPLLPGWLSVQSDSLVFKSFLFGGTLTVQLNRIGYGKFLSGNLNLYGPEGKYVASIRSRHIKDIVQDLENLGIKIDQKGMRFSTAWIWTARLLILAFIALLIWLAVGP
jgi:hypothetical protein